MDNNFALQWKFVESTVNTPILNCVIDSNLNIEHVQIKKLIFFRTLRNLINIIKNLYSYACLCNPIQNKPLWRNKLVRLKKAVMYNEELPDNHDHLSAFRSALNNITFSTIWIYICSHEFNIVEPIKQQELWSKDFKYSIFG